MLINAVKLCLHNIIFIYLAVLKMADVFGQKITNVLLVISHMVLIME